MGVSVRDEHVSPSVLLGVGPDAAEHLLPMHKARVVRAHQMNLTKVNRLISGIDVPLGPVEEPHLGLELAHIRDRSGGICRPVINKEPVFKEHRIVAEVSLLDGQAKLFKDPCGDGNPVDPFVDCFKNTRLEDEVGVGLMRKLGGVRRCLEMHFVVGRGVPDIGGRAQ